MEKELEEKLKAISGMDLAYEGWKRGMLSDDELVRKAEEVRSQEIIREVDEAR